MAVEDKDLLVDDDTFLKNFGSLSSEASASEETTTEETPAATETTVTEEVTAVEVPATEEVATETTTTESVEVEKAEEESTTAAEQQETSPAAEVDKKEVTQEGDYKSFHDELMAPLKAGGKTVQLTSVAEARKLIQQGIDYTRKTQELAPDRKYLALLEKHGLKDEAKLSFVVDLLNKNPEAIKKLITDSGIDPLDIDTSVPVNYSPGNHGVNDSEINFRDVVTELNSAPEGQEIITKVFSTWDQASQGQMWKDPEALRILASQKQSGIFDIVEAELERRSLLGQLPQGISHIQAYHQVGMELGQAGAFRALTGLAQTAATPQPIAKRVATPKATTVNDESVKAAAATRSTKPTAKTNPIAASATLSDEDFLKAFPNLVS